MEKLSVQTSLRCELVDITAQISRIVASEGVGQGIVMVYVPHTTAGVTINENADPDVGTDLLGVLEHLVPRSGSYRHLEGNADAHVKASLVGSSATILWEEGNMKLGTWQGIYLAEFDGPRRRQVYVQVLRELSTDAKQ